MAIKISGSTIIDDNRHIVNAGVVTATSFDGSGADLNSIPNGALDNSSVSYGGVSLSLGGSDATPAFDLTDATSYPYGSLTGISTDILGDTSPKLGGNLDINSKDITGTGNIDITGQLDVSGISTFSSTVGFGTTVGFGATVYINGLEIYHNTSHYIKDLDNILAVNTKGFMVGVGSTFADTMLNITEVPPVVPNIGGDKQIALHYYDKSTSTNTGRLFTRDYGIQINGICSATSFKGDGSALTGIVASGSGVSIKNSGTLVGTASTLNFGANLDVSALSGGAVTITGSAGGGSSSGGSEIDITSCLFI